MRGNQLRKGILFYWIFSFIQIKIMHKFRDNAGDKKNDMRR
jgi:hypothetical protein